MTHHQPYFYLYLPTIYVYMTVLLENLSDKFCAIAPLNKLLSYYLITRLGHCNQYIISMVTDLHIYGQRKTERGEYTRGFFQISKSLFSLYRMILMAIAVIALYIFILRILIGRIIVGKQQSYNATLINKKFQKKTNRLKYRFFLFQK